MRYLPNFVPLDVNGKSDGRNEHTLIRDKYVHENWFSEGLDDEALEDDVVYLMEKDYQYTLENITPSEAHLVGEDRGDLDLARYDLSDDVLYLKEIKGLKDVPGDMSEEERRRSFEAVDEGHDQIAKAIETVENVAMQADIDIDIEHEVIVWSDIFESHEFNSETLPEYEGHHILNSDAYEMARESEAFQALDEGLFREPLLKQGERIRKR